MRIGVLLAFAFALAFTSHATTAQAAPGESRRPNVLLILPDQMRGMDMGCMGNGDVQTPNLDRLASEGVLFRNTFANSPLCGPARAVLLTGQYASRNGMVCNDLRLRESATTVAELFVSAGYRTGFIGKWHLDGGDRDPGFVPPGERRQGFQFWAAHQCGHDHFRQTYFRDTAEPITAERYETFEWAEVGREFLSQESDRPFFLMICPGPPHNPYDSPPEYEKRYRPRQVKPRPNWASSDGGTRRHLAAYYAAITAVDDMVGSLLGALEESGHARDTIVFFTSDHGDMLGSQSEAKKRKPWEESIRVPGILRYPEGMEGGRVVDALWSHVDFAPTLLGLAGIDVPEEMQGTNLARLVLGEDVPGPDSVFFQIFVPYLADDLRLPWRGVRTGDAMYARTREGPWVLYDLANDPFERTNLALEEASAELRDRLDARLTEWMRTTGDDGSLDCDQPVEDEGRLYEKEAFTTLDEYFEWARSHPKPARGGRRDR